MAKMTILDSPVFWDELRKRSEIADAVGMMYGQVGLRQVVAQAFTLKQEYEDVQQSSLRDNAEGKE